MEVHTHTHTARKKWTHYFWEFLMLFLAVFCGFIAENIREHGIEKHREKQYMGSLLKDLEYDTLRMEKVYKQLLNKIPYYDSVLTFLKVPAAFNNALPFRFYVETNLEKFYQPAKPTIEQLKGSGNLRLIHRQTTLDSILNYDSRLNGAYKNQVDYVIEANKRIIQVGEKIFDYSNFNRFISDMYADSSAADEVVYDIILSTANKESIQQAYNIYITAKATDIFYLQMLMGTKKLAVNLITFLKKEYHFK